MIEAIRCVALFLFIKLVITEKQMKLYSIYYKNTQHSSIYKSLLIYFIKTDKIR